MMYGVRSVRSSVLQIPFADCEWLPLTPVSRYTPTPMLKYADLSVYRSSWRGLVEVQNSPVF